MSQWYWHLAWKSKYRLGPSTCVDKAHTEFEDAVPKACYLWLKTIICISHSDLDIWSKNNRIMQCHLAYRVWGHLVLTLSSHSMDFVFIYKKNMIITFDLVPLNEQESCICNDGFNHTFKGIRNKYPDKAFKLKCKSLSLVTIVLFYCNHIFFDFISDFKSNRGLYNYFFG